MCLLIALAACQSDSKDTNYEEQILGRWEIKEALRGGRPTETLTGAFMEFLPKGRMISNIGGLQEESTYALEGNVISSHSQRLPADFTIQYVGDSSLVLQFVLREIPFQFSMTKVPPQPAGE